MTNIYYLGPKGSFSYSAAIKKFPTTQLISCESFTAIVESLASDREAVGVFPVQNLIAGEIKDSISILNSFLYTKIDELKLPINLCLMTKNAQKIDDVKKVYSKDAALAQCKEFLNERNILGINTDSTSAAAKFVAEGRETDIACVGDIFLAQEYGLKVLSENIQDQKENWTLFYFVKAM